jgi:hypothetical protein
MLAALIVSVVTFGALGDGVHDDRPAIQAAIAAARDDGGAVFFPRGEYLVSRAGSAYYALRVDGVDLVGDGAAVTILRQAPGIAASVRLLYVTGDNVSIEDLALDGNRSAQTVSEHRHGIFATDAAGLEVRRVTARAFTGDGFYLYQGVRDAAFDDVLATGNGRNGLTFGARVAGAVVRYSKFVGNVAQQVDSEPGGDHVVSGVRIEGCLLDPAGISGDYALTISGTESAVPARDWRVTGNDIRGGIFIVWAEDITIAGNIIASPNVKSAVTVQRSSRAVSVVGNGVAGSTGLFVQGSGGSGPSRVLLAANRIAVAAGGIGVRADGPVDVDVVGNEIIGGAVAIRLRATVVERPFERATLIGNRASGYTRAAVEVLGSGEARLLSLQLERNELDGNAPAFAVTPGVVLSVSAIGNLASGAAIAP